MQPNLARDPLPMTTSVMRMSPVPKVAGYAIVLSLTLATTSLPPDLHDCLTLQPVFAGGPQTTQSASLIECASATPPEATWLQDTVAALLAEIPDDAWAKVPAIYVADIDKRY